MSVAINAVAGLEIFARGSDNALWHNWHTREGWSGWASLGGSLLGAPAVARHAGGGLAVFSLAADRAVRQIWQTAQGWSRWDSLGGELTGSPAVGMNGDNRLEVFAHTADGQLWHNYQDHSFVNWSGWQPMGVRISGNPAVGLGSGFEPVYGRLCVFVVGLDHTVQFSHQAEPRNSRSWTPFRRIAGPAISDVAVAMSLDQRIELFYAGESGAMHHVYQADQRSFTWSAPSSFGGILSHRPAAIRNADGRLEVFHRGNDRRLHNGFQTAPNNGWSAWHPREVAGVDSFPVAAKNGDGRLEVFALDNVTGNVHHMWQDRASSGPWHAASLGGATLGGLGVRIAELGRCALWETGWH